MPQASPSCDLPGALSGSHVTPSPVSCLASVSASATAPFGVLSSAFAHAIPGADGVAVVVTGPPAMAVRDDGRYWTIRAGSAGKVGSGVRRVGHILYPHTPPSAPLSRRDSNMSRRRGLKTGDQGLRTKDEGPRPRACSQNS